jgi:hypothetical protein
MKKAIRRLTLTLFLACSLLMAGCAAEESEPVLVDPTGFVTYAHPTGVFSLSMPPDWVLSDTSDAYALDVSFSLPDTSLPVLNIYVVSSTALGANASPDALTAFENTGDVITSFDGLVSLYQSDFYRLTNEVYKEIGREIQPDGSLRIAFLIDSAHGTSQHNDFFQVAGQYFVAVRTRLPADPAQQRTLGRVINTLSFDLTTGWASTVAHPEENSPHDLVGFANLNHWADSNGGFVVVGQVINHAPEPLEFVRVNVQLYDAVGEVLTEQDNFVSSDLIMPGEYAPFSIVFSDGLPPGTVRYDLEASARYADYATQTFYGPENFAVTSEAGFDENGLLVVSGQVRNEGNLTANLVKVIVTIFDEDQRVAGTDTTLVDVQQLAPGDTSGFDVRFFELGGAPNTFLVSVQGIIAE